jgi:hypothetical protein
MWGGLFNCSSRNWSEEVNATRYEGAVEALKDLRFCWKEAEFVFNTNI